jgi:hypothetical protein
LPPAGHGAVAQTKRNSDATSPPLTVTRAAGPVMATALVMSGSAVVTVMVPATPDRSTVLAVSALALASWSAARSVQLFGTPAAPQAPSPPTASGVSPTLVTVSVAACAAPPSESSVTAAAERMRKRAWIDMMPPKNPDHPGPENVLNSLKSLLIPVPR